MSFEPEQIQNLVDGQMPIPALNSSVFPILRALLPTSAEKTSLANVASGATQLYATSSTTRTIGTGTLTFTLNAPRDFLLALVYIIISDSADQNRYLIGKVTSCVGTALTVAVELASGTGSCSSWKIGVTGKPGTSGTVTPVIATFSGSGPVTSGTDIVEANGISASTITLPATIANKYGFIVVKNTGGSTVTIAATSPSGLEAPYSISTLRASLTFYLSGNIWRTM